MPYNALNISAKSSVDRGEFCLHCHLHSCLCRGRHIICASQKKMCREVEKSVALTENPLPLCRNVRVARLFCREACAVWWQCRRVQMGAGRGQMGVGAVQSSLDLYAQHNLLIINSFVRKSAECRQNG